MDPQFEVEDEIYFDEVESEGSGTDISIEEFYLSPSSDSSDEEVEHVPTWTRNLTTPNIDEFRENVGTAFLLESDRNELDFFYQFFPESLIEKIVIETNKFASRSIESKPDDLWYPTTLSEMKAYFGIHVIFSVFPIPSYTMAWKTSWPFEFTSIPSIMTRSRYEKISRYFHLNDTTLNPPRDHPGHDKLCHIRPVMDKVLQACLENYHPHKEQSIDEGMIAFKGRLPFKQNIPSKPTKLGIKVWIRASPQNGYVHEFQFYSGCRPGEGLGSRIVKDLTSNLIGKSHVIYTGNYFSSPELFEQLLNQKIYCCGTVRANCRGMPEIVKSINLKNQGEFFAMQRGNLVATAWKDKRIVRYLSTSCDPTQTAEILRRQKDGSLVNTPAPVVAKLYNNFMIGVDLADQKRMQYPTGRKSRKWFKYTFWFCFDVAVVNSLICMQESPNHKKTTGSYSDGGHSQLDFRMALAKQLISSFRGSRKRKVPSVTDNCGGAHWPIKFEKPGRCKGCAKQNKRHEVSIGCRQCNIRLCIKNDCFYKYHTELLN